MPDTLVYACVLGTAIVHAGWNFAMKRDGDRLFLMAAMRVAGLLYAIVLLPFIPPFPMEAVPILIAAAAGHIVYNALLINAYRHGDLSQVYPIARGTAPLLVAIAAFLVIGELPSNLGLGGIVILAFGILLAGFAGFAGNGHALRIAFLTGITIATYSFLGGLGVRTAGTVLGFSVWLEVLTCIPFIGYAAATRSRAFLAFARSWAMARGIVIGLLAVMAYLVSLWAMTEVTMASVTALRETSAVFAALAGTLLLKEGHAAQRILAALLVVTGAVLLAVG